MGEEAQDRHALSNFYQPPKRDERALLLLHRHPLCVDLLLLPEMAIRDQILLEGLHRHFFGDELLGYRKVIDDHPLNAFQINSANPVTRGLFFSVPTLLSKLSPCCRSLFHMSAWKYLTGYLPLWISAAYTLFLRDFNDCFHAHSDCITLLHR